MLTPSSESERQWCQALACGLLIQDAAGQILHANPAAARLLGLTAEQMLGKTPEAVCPPCQEEDQPSPVAEWPHAIVREQGRAVAGMTLWVRRPDGDRRCLQVNAAPLCLETGAASIATSFVDVTPITRAERRLRLLLEAVPDAVVVTESSGRIILVNAQAERLFGYHREELLGQPVELLIPARFRQQHASHRAGYAESPSVRPMSSGFEVRGCRKDGTEFAAEVSLSPIGVEREMLVTSVIRDITERKRMEQLLIEREAHFRSLVENSQDVISVLDASGKRLFVSPSAERLLGYTHDELLARNALELAHPDDVEAVRAAMARAFREPGTGQAVEFRVRRKDGSWRVFEAVGSVPVAPGQASHVIVNMRDVTERRRAEAELRLLQSLTQAMSAAEDLHAALQVGLRTVCEITGWVLGQAWVSRPDSDALELSAAWYSEASSLAPFRRVSEEVVVKAGQGLIGSAWASRRPVWLRDVTQSAAFLRSQAASAVGLKAALAVPVLAGPQVVAVLEFYLSQPCDEDERLVGLVSGATAQLGIVVLRKQAEEDLAVRARQQEALGQFGFRALTRMDLSHLLDEAVATVRDVLKMEYVAILELLPAGRLLRLRAGRGRAEGAAGRSLIDAVPTTLPGYALATDRLVDVEDWRSEQRLHDAAQAWDWGFRSGLATPIRGRARPFGVLYVAATGSRSFSRDEARFAETIANMLAMAVERRQAEELLEYQALHDPLTGLANRTLFLDRLHHALAAAQRRSTVLALLHVDLDDFKEVNDTLGHRAGDQVLQETGRRLRRALRASDTVARLGGDEFAVLLSEAEAPGISRVASDVYNALTRPFDVDGRRLTLDASIGVALYPEHGRNADALLHAADVAMYAVKRAGGGYLTYQPGQDWSEERRGDM